MEYVITAVVTAIVVGIAVFAVMRMLANARTGGAQAEARDILARAERDAADRVKAAELEAKEQALKRKAAVDDDIAKLRDEHRRREQTLDKRQETLELRDEQLRRQEELVEQNQRRFAERIDEINRQREELAQNLAEQRSRLMEISGLREEEARQALLDRLDQELAHEAGARILKHEKAMKELAQQKSRELLLTAMCRYGASHTAESTTSTVDIPSDDMKGRIIGREGRNIRTFEKETGVDVIIDDTPGVVIVSCFDPVRREIAKLSLAKLIADGRIHTTRIEDVVRETTKEIEALIRRKGEEAAQEVDVQGLHERVIYMLGRLHFRTSYSQNVLRHSVEVAFLSGMIAEMIGMDGRLARRCGLLHDIGKAADHELEGGHPKIGADLLKRHGEKPEVVHAALGHHDELVTDKPFTMVVGAADACSASRPGARRESLERYIKRMEELESIATGFRGVSQAFAIQAGRELRVLVNSGQVDDGAAAKLSRDIAKAFEEQLTYPGEIKVTVVRESRFTEVAR